MNRILLAVVLAGVGFHSIGPQQCDGGTIAVHLATGGASFNAASVSAASHTGNEGTLEFNPGLGGGLSAESNGASASVVWNVTSQGASAIAWARTNGPQAVNADAFLLVGFFLTTDGQNTPLSIRSNTDGFPATYVSSGASLSVSASSGIGAGGPLYSSSSMIWTDDGHFPGEREKPREYAGNGGGGPNDTIHVPEGQEDPTIDEGASTANDTTGGYLTSLPVDGSFGVTAPVYFGGLAAVPLTGGGSGTVDYFFRSLSGLDFTSFIAPDGIPGDTSQIFIDDGTTLTPYAPGTTHFFSAPVHRFYLRGLDESAMPGSGPVPFVHGLTFDNPGAAIILHGQVVPEPSSLVLAALGLIGLAAFGWRRRKGR